MLHDPCARCGRTLLELRKDASRETMRGSAPLCAVPGCPLVKRVLGFANAPDAPSFDASRHLEGPSPPAVFVGRHGYPKVAMGPLVPPGGLPTPLLAETPDVWAARAKRVGADASADASSAKELDIGDILGMRARLVRSKTMMAVDARAGHTLEASQAIAMTAKPLETEVTLAKPPRLRFEPKVDTYAAPMGPSVTVIDARVLQSPSVPRRVDAAVSDVHMDAATGAMEMYQGDVSPYHIQRLLSVGLLGRAKARKLVPTRWSITATDDILGKQLIERVKELPQLDAPQVFSSDLFGNYFHVLLMPRAWAFEMIEAWNEGEGWMVGHDLEHYAGRTSYADSITGAYYAARLSVLEHLVDAARRQASVFVYREITEEYWAPLGVWVIREGVKNAMQGKPLVFEDVASAVRQVARRSRTQEWVRTAVLPREARTQRTLKDFLS